MASKMSLELLISAIDGTGPGLDKTSGEVDAAAGKWKGAMIGASTAIGAAWAALNLSQTVADSMEFSSAGTKLSAKLGAVGADAAMLGRVGGQVYAQGFTGGLDEVNTAIAAVRRNLGNLNEADLTSASAQVSALAQMSDESANKISAAAGKMVKTGLAKDWQEALDILTRGLQSNANEAEDLLDTFQEYSTEFRQLGLSGAQALGLMNQGLAAGARNGDVVADALKEFTIRGQTAMKSASQMASAEQAAATAAVNLGRAQDSVKTSGQSLVRSQQSEKAAQEALNAARRQAAADLAGMQAEMDSANLDTHGAELALARAQERLQQVSADTGASMLDKEEAAQAVAEAQRTLTEQQKRVEDLAAAQAEAAKKGVEGSDKVQQAQQGVAAAHDSTTAALKAYKQAQTDAAAAAKTYAAAQAAARETLTPMGQAYRRLGIDVDWAQQSLARGGPAATQVLQQVLDKLRGVKDPAERSAIAVQLFGTKAEDMQQALLALDPSTATKGMQQVAGATKQVTDALANSPEAKVAAMKRGFDEWKASVINTEGPLGQIATVVGAFGGDVGGLLMAIAPMAGTMLMVGAAGGESAVGLGAFAAGMWAATWPVLAIIAVVLVLIGLVVLVIMNWGPISQWFADLWGGISKGFSDFGAAFGKGWDDLWAGVGKGAGDAWKGVTDWGGGIVNDLGKQWTQFSDMASGAATAVWKAHVLAFRYIAQAWNSTLGSISWQVPTWIPFVGGQTWSVPKIPVPALAAGGIVTGPTLALIGEAGDEAVIPLSGSGAALAADVPVVLMLDGDVLAKATARVNMRRR